MSDVKGLRLLKGFQLMILLGCFFIGLIIVSVAAIGINSLPGINERTALLLSAGLQCVIAFMLPAWAAGKFTTKNSFKWLRMRSVPSVKAFVGVIIVYLIALPALNQIISWNEAITFPESMKGLEAALRSSENAAKGMSEKILASMGLWQMLAAVGVVGVLTGIAEEMFFRGGLQNILTMPRRHTLAVWGAAIIFSAVHFQFFGFVPRVLMGVFFGYLLVWTGSLWVPIFAHALNNSIVVVSYYMFGNSDFPDIESLGVSHSDEFPVAAAASAVATAVFLWRFRHYFFFSSSTPHH
ncbi:MAG: CPBP family intramembrane metalloprotease [Bacteroides sp.]|nr:CPBP family intramembrane metalloprotease [Bacteroides sp.]